MNMTLNAGDEVGIASYTRSGVLVSHSFGRVVKINGYGHISVDRGIGEYVKFDKNGRSYKNDYGPELCDPVKLRALIVTQAEAKNTARIAREIEQTMKDGWNYNGRWFKSPERIANLKRLIAELEG